MKYLTIIAAFILFISLSTAQDITYPYPSSSIKFTLEETPLEMSYMDIKPDNPNGQSVILFHGKNFNGYYWKDVIEFLKAGGYRVIVPDQIGWGKSTRANIHYSFHMLALNNKGLLDSLGIEKINVLGHSTGGMLAVRFALMYPERVVKLILENPVGLEDYRTFVPYQPLGALHVKEMAATYVSMKNYQMTYYPEWKPEYEQYVQAQAVDLLRGDYREVAFVNALTTHMIYEQPVYYELRNITVPTLLVIGQFDRTIVGKDVLEEEKKSSYGQYPELGKAAKGFIKDSKLVELDNVGHIPHVQDLPAFQKAVMDFLKE